MTQWRMVVRDEDLVPIFTITDPSRDVARRLAETWLLGFTDERRKATDTRDSDEGWLLTLFDNGFFNIAMYEE